MSPIESDSYLRVELFLIVIAFFNEDSLWIGNAVRYKIDTSYDDVLSLVISNSKIFIVSQIVILQISLFSKYYAYIDAMGQRLYMH